MKKNIKKKSIVKRMRKILFLLILFISANTIFAQVEMVPVGHSVYKFLKRMQLEGFIPEYNSASLPISRGEVAEYLLQIANDKEQITNSKEQITNSKEQRINKINSVDRRILEDYMVEFGYDINKDLRKTASLFKGGNIFDDDKQKYLYAFADSNVNLFLLSIGRERGFFGKSFFAIGGVGI